jgi:hypothetical protein
MPMQAEKTNAVSNQALCLSLTAPPETGCQPFSAPNTSSSIFFASPKSIRLFSL